MPEFRKDPISDNWVIIAQERSHRPFDYQRSSDHIESTVCPFCEGNEQETPGEILALRRSSSLTDRSGWSVRVVPNQYPALVMSLDKSDKSHDFYVSRHGFGSHEVIIESPRHIKSFTELQPHQATEVVSTYHDRMRALKADGHFVYGLIFKNFGEAAGASLEHIHSQLLATPVTPRRVQQEWCTAKAFHESQGDCVFCHIMRHEIKTKDRVVLETNQFLVFCPFASRFPYELMILPKEHYSHFEEIPEQMISELSQCLHEALARLENVISDCSYNYLIHTSPFDTGPVAHYHWHVEILPRMTTDAGFEWGTDYYINYAPPEESAQRLRNTGGVPATESFPDRNSR